MLLDSILTKEIYPNYWIITIVMPKNIIYVPDELILGCLSGLEADGSVSCSTQEIESLPWLIVSGFMGGLKTWFYWPFFSAEVEYF